MTEVGTLVCGHVFRDERPVMLVIRHADDGWQCTCGKYDHPDDCSDFKVVGMEHLIERQGNLLLVADLKPNWLAEFDNGKWNEQLHDD